jgi:phosphoribosyl 1,2-cyclic phosphate phosphodiesterase
MLRTKTTHLDAVVFTHPHRDHYAGLDDIRPFNFHSNKPMQIYANEITQVAIKRPAVAARQHGDRQHDPEV